MAFTRPKVDILSSAQYEGFATFSNARRKGRNVFDVTVLFSKVLGANLDGALPNIKCAIPPSIFCEQSQGCP